MKYIGSFTTSRLFALLAALVIWKVAWNVVIEYREYFPPNFNADFLRGREAYFHGAYQWAFYTHLFAGPTSLLVGTILVSDRFRVAFPAWHRRLGRVQAVCVLLLVAPSGLWMAFYAQSGAVTAAGFASLALATAGCVALGWRSAVRRKFAEHRVWMWRAFLLLCSAVVIRLIGGLATVLQVDAQWLYPLSAWASWLAPLAVFETSRLLNRPVQRVANPA